MNSISKNGFECILNESINRVLSSYGRIRKNKILKFLEELGVGKEEISHKLSELSIAVEETLGPDAFNFKTKLLSEVQSKLEPNRSPRKYECFVPDITFEEYLRLKRFLFLLERLEAQGGSLLNDGPGKAVVLA